VQPMHSSATMRAIRRGCSVPQAGSTVGSTGRPVAVARRTMPSTPPGGQRSIGAPSATIARA